MQRSRRRCPLDQADCSALFLAGCFRSLTPTECRMLEIAEGAHAYMSKSEYAWTIIRSADATYTWRDETGDYEEITE